MRKQRLHAMQVLSTMGVTLASVLLPVALGLGVDGSPAGAATQPLCRTSQLSVSVAPILVNHVSGNFSIRITFTNSGRTCKLPGEVPAVATVVGTNHAPVGHDIVFYLPYLRPLVLTHGQSAVSWLFVDQTTTRRNGCRSVTTSGLVISDGLPNGSSRYVHYVIHGVCSSPAHPNLIQSTYSKPVA